MKANDIYCNPVQLPDIPKAFHGKQDSKQSGFTYQQEDFRDAADPEVLYYEGKWYVFASQGQAYVSDDLINWEYNPIDIEMPLGYAPTITTNNGKFYVTSSPYLKDGVSRIFEAPTPLGPYKFIGSPVDMNGQPLQHYLDPCLFTDDDGRMYLYWGCAPFEDGIYGMEVDAQRPWMGISSIQTVIVFNGNNYWEREGVNGEVLDFGWDEGVSMYKYNGKYLLQYSANGTVFPTYAIGCYVGQSPLGPFNAPKDAMILTPHGLVCGTGHGGIFSGPDGSPWLAYSCYIHRVHQFERRIGIDPVTFDEDGFPHVKASARPRSITRGDLGLFPVSHFTNAAASSALPGSRPFYAVDECPHTYWAPAFEDEEPTLTVNLRFYFEIQAFRIIWAELNLNYEQGIVPEPIKYTITFKDKEQNVVGIYDGSANSQDLNVDFHVIKPIRANHCELRILKRAGSRLKIGVQDFALFAPPTRYFS